MSSTYFKLYVDWILAKNSCFLDLIWIHLKTSHKLQSQGAISFWSHHLQILPCLLHSRDVVKASLHLIICFIFPYLKRLEGKFGVKCCPFCGPATSLGSTRKTLPKAQQTPALGACVCEIYFPSIDTLVIGMVTIAINQWIFCKSVWFDLNLFVKYTLRPTIWYSFNWSDTAIECTGGKFSRLR